LEFTFRRCLGMMLSGDTIDVLNFQGEPIRDDTFLILINAITKRFRFFSPARNTLNGNCSSNTAIESGFLAEPKSFASGDEMAVVDRGACLLKLSGRGTGASAPGIVPETPL